MSGETMDTYCFVDICPRVAGWPCADKSDLKVLGNRYHLYFKILTFHFYCYCRNYVCIYLVTVILYVYIITHIILKHLFVLLSVMGFGP